MKFLKAITTVFLLINFTGCFSSPFKSISYDATFDMIDTSKDGIITLDEFSNHFPESKKEFPPEADADNDGKIYPDEWFEFREKKGYMKTPPE